MARVRDKDMLSFKEATKSMSGREKFKYVWEYYKWHIIGSVAGFILIFSMVHAFVTQRDTYLSVTFVSGFEHTSRSFGGFDEPEPDEDEFDMFAEGPPGIWVDFEIVSRLEDLLLTETHGNRYEITVNHLGINFETLPVLSTHLGAGILDLLVTYAPDFEVMIDLEYFHNIQSLGWDLPDHVFHGEYGIYLRYFPIFDDYVRAIDDLVVGLIISTSNLENIERFFELALER